MADFSKVSKREATPEENLKANSVLSLLTIVACFTLAILLYAILGFRENTHWLIYAAAGLLIAIGGWHIQTFIRTRQLRRQWQRRMQNSQSDVASIGAVPTSKLLNTPVQEPLNSASVTEDTTRHLTEIER